MATRLRQGCEDRHGDHSEEPTPEDYGLTLDAGNIWKHPLVVVLLCPDALIKNGNSYWG